jgi:ribonuclease T1
MRALNLKISLRIVAAFWLCIAGLLLQPANVAAFQGQTVQSVSLAELPGEARATLQLIRQGCPFPYPRDGVVFGNYEKNLPKMPRGYYHEYTVKTPGARNRGARRIVCGRQQECYYTADHYRTFQLIRE